MGTFNKTITQKQINLAFQGGLAGVKFGFTASALYSLLFIAFFLLFGSWPSSFSNFFEVIFITILIGIIPATAIGGVIGCLIACFFSFFADMNLIKARTIGFSITVVIMIILNLIVWQLTNFDPIRNPIGYGFWFGIPSLICVSLGTWLGGLLHNVNENLKLLSDL